MSTTSHTPGPMRPFTDIEKSANAAIHWRQQYRDWDHLDTFADGTTKESIDNALNRSAHTPEFIAATINDGWAYPSCSSCGQTRHVVIQMVSPWGSDVQWEMCLPCLEHAAGILSQYENARAAIAKATNGTPE